MSVLLESINGFTILGLAIAAILVVALFGMGSSFEARPRDEEAPPPPKPRETPAPAPAKAPPTEPDAALADAPTVPPAAPRPAPMEYDAAEARTDAPFLQDIASSAPTANGNLFLERVPSAELAGEEEERNPLIAAQMWMRRGDWGAVARCYEKKDRYEDAAAVWASLGRRDLALPLLQKAIASDPENEALRLRAIETMMDMGLRKDADRLVDEIVAPDGKVPFTSAGLEALARDYEAIADNERAYQLYLLAISKGGTTSTEIQQRALFIKTVNRLASSTPGERPITSPANEMLRKYILQSGVYKVHDSATGKNANIQGHEIIVGHLALGFQQHEPTCSVRSVFSLSRRFLFDRLLSESAIAATFHARDRLLDFPVALKMYRLPDDFASMDLLRARLHAVGQLNHPNLAKLTFVDREGPILRIATEYLPGGNLRDFLSKLGGIGMPLILRMAMHLASCLHTAHMRGVPHGDVRPENIMIGHDQRIKLVDFALSPIPVKRPEFRHVSVGEREEITGLESFFARNEGVQSDILQFAEVFEFLLSNARKTIDPIKKEDGEPDPMEEMRELLGRLRNGGFTSILRVWQVLETIFERTMPPGSSSRS